MERETMPDSNVSTWVFKFHRGRRIYVLMYWLTAYDEYYSPWTDVEFGCFCHSYQLKCQKQKKSLFEGSKKLKVRRRNISDAISICCMYKIFPKSLPHRTTVVRPNSLYNALHAVYVSTLTHVYTVDTFNA